MKIFSQSVSIVVLSAFLMLGFASPAFARCRDARKTCDYISYCLTRVGKFVGVIQVGIRTNNGNAVWNGTNKCAGAGIKNPNNNRTFDDIANGCSDGEYAQIGKGLVNCNQFPE
jgi:hypothetical protein